MPGHPTPIGLFSVIGKERWHHSNIYCGAPMPFMQRITWSGVAMHSGVVPGYPASHGCIRLPAAFAPQLWGMTKMGARVVVARRETIPVRDRQRVPAAAEDATGPGGAARQPAMRRASAPIELASMRPAGGAVNRYCRRARMRRQRRPPHAAKLLNPIEYAEALKARATADKAAAEQGCQGMP